MASPVALAASWYQTPVTDFADMTDEIDGPVVCPAEGCAFDFPTRYGPPRYPGDSTGAAAAHEQDDSTEPVMVLNMKTSTAGVHDVVLDVTTVDFLSSFVLNRYMTTGAPQFYALFGHWSDYNGDGYIQNDEWEKRDVGCTVHDDVNPTTCARGSLAYRVGLDPVSVQKRDTTFDADVDDEWTGVTSAIYKDGDASKELVIYSTGYGWRYSGSCGPVNACQTGEFRAQGTSEGIVPFSQFDPISENDGYHKTKILICGLACEGMFDPSILVTTVWETYVGQGGVRSYAGCDDRTLHPNGCRTYQPVDGLPYDVDVHKQLDSDVTTLYTSTLTTYRDQGEQLNQTYRQHIRDRNALTNSTVENATETYNATWYGNLKPVLLGLGAPDTDAARNATLVAVEDAEAFQNQKEGEADDVFFPPTHDGICADGGVSNCWADAYNETWHPYMDVRPLYGVTVPAPAFILKGGCAVNCLPNPNRNADGSASSDWGMLPAQLYVVTTFGLWRDKTAESGEYPDGFITRHNFNDPKYPSNGPKNPPPIQHGCEDRFQCGANDNPNNYGTNTERTTGVHEEWFGVCADITVRVTPLTPGTAWPGGAYIMGRDQAVGGDTLTPIANDVADGDKNGDGNPVDRLITSGAFTTVTECNASDVGTHHPQYYLLLPQGTATFDMQVEVDNTVATGGIGGHGGKGVCVRHNNGVVGATGDLECAYDRDVLRAWAS